MDLSELTIVPIRRVEQAQFLSLMREHHYLGAPHKIGESAFYAAVLQGRWVALSSFYACALKSRVRDQWLGWHPRDRDARLHLITNQSRFLVLESIPNLASRTLSLLAKRVAKDWPLRFGHPLLLIETFVDPQLFKATCYRAENWLELGRSAGFRRHSSGYRSGSSPKLMMVRPLVKNARQLLADAHLDSRYFPQGVCRKMYTPEDFKTLLDYFSHIDDPRGKRGRRYRLETLLGLAAAAVASGARGYLEIGEWIQAQSDTVLRYFKVGKRKGKVNRPSVYCIRNALVKTDPEQFDRAVYDWRESIDGRDDAIAIDGKTLCGAIDENDRQLHVLGAHGHRSGMPLGKKKHKTHPQQHTEAQIHQ